MSINPCGQCPVFIMCSDMCHAKINYGMSLEVYIKACLNRVGGLNMQNYYKYKKMQFEHRDQVLEIELRIEKRNQNNRT